MSGYSSFAERFPYRVYVEGERMVDVFKWLVENVGTINYTFDNFDGAGCYFFKYKDHAVMFKLRWG